MSRPPALIAASTFRRLALQRLEVADFLFRHDYPRDAVYLGGYAVECALKALILHRSEASRQTVVRTRISRGARGHDLEFLKGELRNAGVSIPMASARSLRTVSSWSTDLRYDTTRVELREAEVFLRAVSDIVEWMKRSL